MWLISYIIDTPTILIFVLVEETSPSSLDLPIVKDKLLTNEPPYYSFILFLGSFQAANPVYQIATSKTKLLDVF